MEVSHLLAYVGFTLVGLGMWRSMLRAYVLLQLKINAIDRAQAYRELFDETDQPARTSGSRGKPRLYKL